MTGTYNYKNENILFNFSTNLRAYEKVKFVNSVTDTLVADNYNSVLRDLIFDFQIINIFTDVDTSELSESPDTINSIEDFLEETNIVKIVRANADKGLMEELEQAVDKNIEYRTGIHRDILSDTLVKFISLLEEKISTIDTENMMAMAEKISSISGKLTAENVVNAYAQSDIFKESHKKEVEKRKNQTEFIKEIIDNTESIYNDFGNNI